MYVTEISQQQVLLRRSKKPQDAVGTNHPNKAIKKRNMEANCNLHTMKTELNKAVLP